MQSHFVIPQTFVWVSIFHFNKHVYGVQIEEPPLLIRLEF